MKGRCNDMASPQRGKRELFRKIIMETQTILNGITYIIKRLSDIEERIKKVEEQLQQTPKKKPKSTQE